MKSFACAASVLPVFAAPHSQPAALRLLLRFQLEPPGYCESLSPLPKNGM